MKPTEPTYTLVKTESDKALMFRLSNSEESAFATIYNKYWKLVYRAADKLLQSSAQAQDVVQEVFSTVWSQRHHFAEVENLEAYIRIMARNRIYSELRACSRERLNMENYMVQAETSINDCDFAILNSQNDQLLEEILSLLPPRQQEVFNLARKDGLTHEKIAEQLNLSTGTVKNHMVRALQAIRSHIEPYLTAKIYFFLSILLSDYQAFNFFS